MNDTLSQAETLLLAPADLTVEKVRQQLAMEAHGLDWLDVYVQHSIREGWQLEDGKVKMLTAQCVQFFSQAVNCFFPYLYFSASNLTHCSFPIALRGD
jgi:hypothetical protein